MSTQSQFFSGNLIVAGVLRDPSGAIWIKDAPSDGTIYGRQNGAWVSAGGGSGISDAPSDGTPYGRLNGTWADLYAHFAELAHGHSISGITGLADALDARSLVGHTHPWSDITSPPDFSLDGHTHDAADVDSGILDPERLGSGTPSSSLFLRGDGAWATPPTGDVGDGITDAPNDGSFYGRKSLGWVTLTAADIASGTIATARLGSGTASSSKFLRGDQSWQTLSVSNITDITDWGGTFVGSIDAAAGRTALELGDSATKSVGTGSTNVAAGDHVHAFSTLTSKPTTLSGYGITDGVATSRQVATQHSLAGGGDLTANRTLSLVGDTASPGNSKLYGTDGSGNRGFYDIGASHTHPDLANFVFVTVSAVTDTNQDATYRSVLGTVKSGYSATLAGGSLASGSVIKIEAAGVFVGDDSHSADVELKIGSGLKLHFDITEPQSTGPTEGTPWSLTAWITVTTAGSSATVNVNGWMDYADNTGGSSGVYAPSPLSRSKGIVSGTLNTTIGNAVDLVYRGNDTNSDSFSCTHFILQQY